MGEQVISPAQTITEGWLRGGEAGVRAAVSHHVPLAQTRGAQLGGGLTGRTPEGGPMFPYSTIDFAFSAKVMEQN